MFVEHCVNRIELNKEKIDGYVKNSLMLVTALSPGSAMTRPRKSPIPRITNISA